MGSIRCTADRRPEQRFEPPIRWPTMRPMTSEHPPDLDPTVVARALDERRPPDRRALVRFLAPVIQTRVARLLVRRYGRATTTRLRAEIEDLTQEIFVRLFADDGRRLRAWDQAVAPARPFFGLVAERIAMNLLASRNKKPWMDDTADPSDIGRDRAAAGPGPERRAVSRDALRRLVGRLGELNARDRALFQLIYVEQAEVGRIAETLGIKPGAVYQGKRRLRQRLAALHAEIGT